MALLLCLPVNARSQSSTDEELYTRACAACHGDDGAGRSVEDVGFATPLPDFTDCEFTSREPDPDWYAIIHQGGPVRAFDRMMPAFGMALASHEIDAILRHVRTFCSNDAWPRGEFNLPRPLFTEKAFPEDEIVVTTAVGAGSPGTVESEFLYEKRFGPTGMLEIALPAGWRGAADAGASAPATAGHAFGLADLAIGWKQTVHHNLQRGSIFSVGGEVVLAADGPRWADRPTGHRGAVRGLRAAAAARRVHPGAGARRTHGRPVARRRDGGACRRRQDLDGGSVRACLDADGRVARVAGSG